MKKIPKDCDHDEFKFPNEFVCRKCGAKLKDLCITCGKAIIEEGFYFLGLPIHEDCKPPYLQFKQMKEEMEDQKNASRDEIQHFKDIIVQVCGIPAEYFDNNKFLDETIQKVYKVDAYGRKEK